MSVPRNDRSLTWLPIVGAAVVAAIGVTVVILVGSGRDQRPGLKEDANGALVCLSSYHEQAVTGVKRIPRAYVPFRPTGIDGSADLVPDTKPQRVTVCRYPSAGADLGQDVDIRLGGTTVLTKGLSAMTKSLSKAPKSATTSGSCTGPDTTYMVGFRFATGVVWVTVPGTGCQAITNGVWDTRISIGQQVASAYTTGEWR